MIDNKKIHSKLTEIANIILKKDYAEVRNNGLYDGTSGIALFCFLYYKEFGIQTFWDKGLSLLNQGIDIAGDNSDTSIFNGLSGLTWTCRFLFENGILNNEDVGFLEEADDYLYKKMIYGISQNDLDFFHGSIGIATYFASRMIKKKETEKYISDCVTMLQKSCIKDEQGCRWLFYNKKFPDMYTTNLGLSHGMASIVILLSKIYRLYNNENEVLSLTLKESVKFLLQQRFSDVRRSLFPKWAQNIDKVMHSRMGLCNGDLGIALSIYHAAKSLNDQALIQHSIDCFLHSAQRNNNLPLDMIYDCAICHGTAGIALIFFRMYKNTGIEELKNAYEFWFNKTLNMASFENGLAGFKTWRGSLVENNYTLLTGIAGIGLSLLSLISKEDLFWDECLLLS